MEILFYLDDIYGCYVVLYIFGNLGDIVIIFVDIDCSGDGLFDEVIDVDLVEFGFLEGECKYNFVEVILVCGWDGKWLFNVLYIWV